MTLEALSDHRPAAADSGHQIHEIVESNRRIGLILRCTLLHDSQDKRSSPRGQTGMLGLVRPAAPNRPLALHVRKAHLSTQTPQVCPLRQEDPNQTSP